MASATPPVDFYPAAWLGLALLALVLFEPSTTRRWLHGALRGWLFGTAVNFAVLRFVPHTITRFTDLPLPVGLLALLLLAMFQGIPWAFAGWVTCQLHERRVPMSISFGAGVWVSAFVPTVFPWTVAGGISAARHLVQIADVIGERGVTALLAVSAALCAEGIRAVTGGRRLAAGWLALSVAVPALMIVYGLLRVHAIERVRELAPTVRIALVQPSTEARMRWDPQAADGIVQRLTMLTKAAEQRGAEVVVWPEAAYPYTMQATSRADLVGPYAVLQAGVRGPVLTGLLMHARDGSYNSATLVHGGRVDPPYHKMHLLAFGEAVPLASTFPALRRMFARGTGMIAGEHQVLLSSGPMHATVLNCFEDTLPEAGREAAGVNPNLLVNLTNDAWFVETRESELHLRLATMRAIELRRDLVRAVNLGPTSWVDATGLVRKRYDGDIPGSLPTEPALLEGHTLYARFGDFMGALFLALLGGAWWLGMRTKNKRRAV
jgi:apolipoprotein N-acyltransferase